MIPILRSLPVALLLCALFGSALAVDAPGPEETVEALMSRVGDLELIWDGMSLKDRRRKAQPLVEDFFASGRMLRLALGEKARGLTRSQRVRLEEAFRLFLLDRVPLRLFGAASAASVETRLRKLQSRRVGVRRETATAEGRSLRFDYILARQSGRWRVVNLFRNGVSELALWRTEFNRLLTDKGADALARRLSGVSKKEKQGG